MKRGDCKKFPLIFLRSFMTIIIPDLEILNEEAIEFKMPEKTFKIQLLSAYYYNLYHNLFMAYMIEVNNLFGKEEITIGNGKVTLSDTFAQSIIHNQTFQYIVFQLFTMLVYPDKIIIETDWNNLSDFQKKIYEKDFDRRKQILEEIDKCIYTDFAVFLKALKGPEILTLYFYILIVNLFGFKKKLKIILNEIRNLTGKDIGELSITQLFSDYMTKGKEQWGKMKIVDGKAVYSE
jgi:hypothetical protein